MNRKETDKNIQEDKNVLDVSEKKSLNAEGMAYFHFDLSEKGHEVIIPFEEESSWEQLNDITWDPGRGD